VAAPALQRPKEATVSETTPVLVKACLNGRRPRGSHPALPVTPDELAAAAKAVMAAGAGAVHVHPRGEDGNESQSAEVIGAAVGAIRAACPGLPVGVTTGAWIANDPATRLEQVSAWRVLPDFCSVNWFEEGAEALAELLIGKGVGVEAGLGSVRDAQAFAASAVAAKCLRVLVEVRDRDGTDAVELAGRMDAVLDAGGSSIPRLHHGFGQGTWRVVAAAFDRGRDVRIGLEDTQHLPGGVPAPDNAALVARAVELGRRFGREAVRVA
jgi:uncharacterized protein (DUF849 family)